MIVIQSTNEKRNGVHFEVDENQPPLGVGGMGQVFKGVRVDERSGIRTEVAIKFLFDDLPKNVLQRAMREASIQIKNQNLLEMMGFIQIDSCDSDGRIVPHYHVVSELLYGVSLFDFLQGKFIGTQGKDIQFARQLFSRYQENKDEVSAEIVKNILSALMALHDAGYVHRDVDTTNIMLTDAGAIKLIDFGIAKKIENLSGTDAGLTTAGQFMGKAAYAAPELVLGDVPHQNATTDIYALGILLFQLVSGKLPFTGSVDEVLNHQRFDKLPLELISDKKLRKIISKATEKKQSMRFQSAAEFRVALDNYLKDAGNGTRGISFEKIKKPLIWGLGAACAVVATVVLVRSLSMRREESDLLAQESRNQIIERCNMLKSSNVMFDSADPDSVCFDEIVDTFKIHSAAYYTLKAEKLLEAGNKQQADSLLSVVADKGYKSSAQAVYLQSVIIFENALSEENSEVRNNLLASSHEKRKLAVKLDSTLYKATFELANDYIAGVRRTGNQERDMDAAQKYLTLSKKYAEAEADLSYLNKCDSLFTRYQNHLR